MKRVLIPGSYDPITTGHLDVIRRAAALFDEVTVAVFDNPDKSYTFDKEKRLAFVRESVKDMPNVSVDSFDGLLVDYVRARGFDAVVRGLRDTRDFEYEAELARIYASTGGVETVMLPADATLSFVSSSMVRELIKYGGDPSPYLPFEYKK